MWKQTHDIAKEALRRPHPVSGVSVEELALFLSHEIHRLPDLPNGHKIGMMEVGFDQNGQLNYGPYWMGQPDTDKIFHALLQQSAVQPADGGWVAVERLMRAARFGVEAVKGRILAYGDLSEYSKANLDQLFLTMDQLDSAINALPPPPADKGKGE